MIYKTKSYKYDGSVIVKEFKDSNKYKAFGDAYKHVDRNKGEYYDRAEIIDTTTNKIVFKTQYTPTYKFDNNGTITCSKRVYSNNSAVCNNCQYNKNCRKESSF